MEPPQSLGTQYKCFHPHINQSPIIINGTIEDLENSIIKIESDQTTEESKTIRNKFKMCYNRGRWVIQPKSEFIKQKTNIENRSQHRIMKKFPHNPLQFNPVQLLHFMIPGIVLTELIERTYLSVFQFRCRINGFLFLGEGRTKKGAKTELAISIIKHFWDFDYHDIYIKAESFL